ncbi:MAG: hypothetical protein E3J67_01500 [Dehalococcoidia bacterium]|nr:MAG: hypothetical protein E3J67_01500 [Dehalococcoidia bacterium]
MKAADEPVEVEHLARLNEYGPDDLFICCASFEERSTSSVSKMGIDYRTNFAIIFAIEEPLYKQQVEKNLYRLQAELGKRTSKGIFVISYQKENPIEGINQLKNIWEKCKPRNPEEPYITIDISGFTKIYLLELFHHLVIELNLGIPRILHTTQTYLPTKLTRGVEQITTIPNFYGSISWEKQFILILLLGFEPERSLAVWKHFNPKRTIALVTNPPRYGHADYLKYARQNNSYLLSQPSVEVRDVPPDNPYAVKKVLETVYSETRESFNMVIGPFGTKPQTVGVFLFYLEHPKVQVIYSYPIKYTRSYLQRKAGPTLLLPLAPAVT